MQKMSYCPPQLTKHKQTWWIVVATLENLFEGYFFAYPVYSIEYYAPVGDYLGVINRKTLYGNHNREE